jgi:hypothetical protein
VEAFLVMYLRVSQDARAAFERDIRRKRIRLYLWAYPFFVALGSALLIVKLHAAYHLYNIVFRSGQDSDHGAFMFAAGVIAVVALGVFWILWQVNRGPLIQAYPYCSKCDAFDYVEKGQCPRCGDPLQVKALIFHTIYDGEVAIAKGYGLNEVRSE